MSGPTPWPPPSGPEQPYGPPAGDAYPQHHAGGQSYPGQPYPGQPYGGPAYAPYGAWQPGPPKDKRPGMFTAGAVVAIVMSSLMLMYSGFGFFVLVTIAEIDDAADWIGWGEELTAARIITGVSMVASLAAIIAAAQALGRSRGAYYVLLGCTVVALVLELTVVVWGFVDEEAIGFGPGAIMWLAGTVTAFVLMLVAPVRRWIHGDRGGGPLPPPSNAVFH